MATRPIPRGTITWVRDPLDMTFTEEQAESLDPLYRATLDKYCFVEGSGMRVLCWDIARYVNHSCDAPTLSPGYDFELAVRDIDAGEEVRDDYGLLNLGERLECACGSPECRKVLMPGDREGLADAWDARVRAAFARLREVPQPLWSLVTEKAAVEEALRDPSKLLSCRAHFAR